MIMDSYEIGIDELVAIARYLERLHQRLDYIMDEFNENIEKYEVPTHENVMHLGRVEFALQLHSEIAEMLDELFKEDKGALLS